MSIIRIIIIGVFCTKEAGFFPVSWFSCTASPRSLRRKCRRWYKAAEWPFIDFDLWTDSLQSSLIFWNYMEIKSLQFRVFKRQLWWPCEQKQKWDSNIHWGGIVFYLNYFDTYYVTFRYCLKFPQISSFVSHFWTLEFFCYVYKLFMNACYVRTVVFCNLVIWTFLSVSSSEEQASLDGLQPHGTWWHDHPTPTSTEHSLMTSAAGTSSGLTNKRPREETRQ